MHIPSHDLQLALDAADAAGAFIKNQFQHEIESIKKSDYSLVTEVDKTAETLIRKILSDSNHGFIGEEFKNKMGSSGADWVIDPIDGTTNFYRKQQAFAVSIALMRGEESVLGVVQNPITGECFYAEKGGGAFLNDEPIKVSENKTLLKSIVFFNYGSAEPDRRKILDVVEGLIYEFDLRIWGTTAWEMCAVAKGTADAFVCVGDKIWDFAAAMCIVKEAGGTFTDWRGEPWKASHSYVIAAQPSMLPLIVERVEALQ